MTTFCQRFLPGTSTAILAIKQFAQIVPMILYQLLCERKSSSQIAHTPRKSPSSCTLLTFAVSHAPLLLLLLLLFLFLFCFCFCFSFCSSRFVSLRTQSILALEKALANGKYSYIYTFILSYIYAHTSILNVLFSGRRL